MAAHPQTRVDDILAELRTQLDAHGEVGGPKIARLKWPNVSSSSWSRYVQKARQEWTESMRLRQEGLPSASIPGDATAAAPAAEPSAPAQHTEPSHGAINWIAQVRGMLKQCDLLTRQAVIVDPATGIERVRNPVVLRQAISARATALKLAADREQVLFSAERVLAWERRMVREIYRAIGKVRTEDQKVISTRVQRALEGVMRRRAEEREFLTGGMTPRTETAEVACDKPE